MYLWEESLVLLAVNTRKELCMILQEEQPKDGFSMVEFEDLRSVVSRGIG